MVTISELIELISLLIVIAIFLDLQYQHIIIGDKIRFVHLFI